MKTKILYILASSQSDIFWEQTFLSITSLRKTNPSVKVALLMDNITYSTLSETRAMLLKIIDEPVVISLDNVISNKEKSRVLKTNMRNYVDGDFLYIDSDTLILSDLSTIDDVQYELGAVYELNRSLGNNYGRASFEEATNRFDCYFSDEDEYFNSGVMLVKDTKNNHDFFSKWHEEWQKGKKIGIYFDQPSLGCVNKMYNSHIKPLDGSWNCQGRYCLNFIRDAKIFHYFYDSFFVFPLMDKNYFEEFKKKAVISSGLLDILINPFKHITENNEILTGDDVRRLHSRLYALIRLLDNKAPRLYSFIDNTLDFFYKKLSSIKPRRLAPPR